MTGLAVLCMGPQGQMIGAAGRGRLLALSFLGFAGVKCLKRGRDGVLQQAAHLSARHWGRTGRILDTTVLFSALIGFGSRNYC